MNQSKENFNFIYIKTPYFDNKEQLRKVILDEISKILNDNGIFNMDFLRFRKYLNSVKLGCFSFVLGNKSYDKIVFDLEEDINDVKKKIILVIDDLDRVESKNQIIEILNFIGELNLELGNNFSLITLSSKNKLEKIINEKNVIEGEKYLDKYFTKEFFLSKISFENLIDYFSNEYSSNEDNKNISKNLINNFKKLDLSTIEDNSESKKIVEEFIKRITFRNIQKLVLEIKEINSSDNNFEEKIFIKIIKILSPKFWKILKQDSDFKNKIDSNNQESQYYPSIRAEIFRKIKVDDNNMKEVLKEELNEKI